MKLLITLFSLLLLPLTSYAETLPPPQGKVLLTISGNIANSQKNGDARFDREQLAKLPSDTFILHTRWTNKAHTYDGPLLSAILDHVGSKGTTIRLTALNDYSIVIEKSYIDKYQPILAILDDGKEMSIRDKGPLWLLLPQDKYPELKTEENTGNMIWQLSHIEIE